uniref:Reticulon-like protein n=1 Tax=Rhizophora mucronata TaxID=61149 RepID=A0A2P2L7G7_RHIMU
MALTIKSFSHLAEDFSSDICTDSKEQSKADKLLGGGKVADILLWREEKETFVDFLVLSLLFYWFLISGRTFTTSAASLLLSTITILYGYGILPSKIRSHFNIQRIPLSSFEISEKVVKDIVTSIASLWNRWFDNIKILAKGEDWNHFFKVAFSLYFVKSFVLQSLTVAIGAALVLAFTAFFIYEQYESEIDGLVNILFNNTKGFLRKYLPASIASFLENNGILHKGNCTAADKKK